MHFANCCSLQVLQRLMSGVLTSVLRPRETQCPVVRSIARELLTCLVMQPLMNFASPGYAFKWFTIQSESLTLYFLILA